MGLGDGIQGEGGGINLSDISLRERDSACESRWQLPWQNRTTVAEQFRLGVLLCCTEWARSLGWESPSGVREEMTGVRTAIQQLDIKSEVEIVSYVRLMPKD